MKVSLSGQRRLLWNRDGNTGARMGFAISQLGSRVQVSSTDA